MCSSQPLLIQGRPLSNFQAPTGINLTDSLGCSIGAATANSTGMDAAAYQNYQATLLETTFGQTNVCLGLM
jgi:hypothetical protein